MIKLSHLLKNWQNEKISKKSNKIEKNRLSEKTIRKQEVSDLVLQINTEGIHNVNVVDFIYNKEELK